MAKIVFIGDSITKGTDYGGVTALDTFASKIGFAAGHTTVINAGVGSDTSTGVLARLQTAVINQSPDICVVMIGINDWGNSVNLQTYRSNVGAIFKALRVSGIKVVAMTTSLRRGGSQPEFLSLQPYIQVFEYEARALRIPVIDLYREMAASYLYLPNSEFNALYVDELHLTISGHTFVANLAMRPSFSGVFL